MTHPEKKESRRYDCIYRNDNFTAIVYGGVESKPQQLRKTQQDNYPPKNEYKFYFGELHGHTNLSDATPDIDSYFKTARYAANLDFCAITDHDHGGVGAPELWGDKWKIIQQKVQEYHQDHKFITILAYEKDAYPWYNNLVLYYKGDSGEMVRGERDGNINKAELTKILERDDIITIPHTTSFLHSGCDFTKIPKELMTPLIEVYSRWGTSEFMGNPNPKKIETRGGYWQDALERGVKMGCISGSDDHRGGPGLITKTPTGNNNLRYNNPGTAVVLTKELTREAIFNALKERRCYATSGAKIELDFRINNNVMGSDIFLSEDETREIFIDILCQEEPVAIKTVTLVSNAENKIIYHVDGESNHFTEMIYDYDAERKTDYYYIRVELTDGRMAWSSPIWITKK